MDIKKPNFIIIGTAKCGTSTLSRVLAEHPDCCFSRPKEVEFFYDDNNYSKGWEWYKKAFTHYNNELVIGESTPAYSDRVLHPETAKRIHQFNPNMKLIYIVRDPYEKFVSTWRMWARKKWPTAMQGINYFFEHESNNKWSTVKSCCYSYQLEAYKQYFPEDAFLIIFLEELSRDPLQQYQRVFQFLKLEPSKFDWNNIHIKENGANQHYKTNKYWTYLQQSRMRLLVKNVLPTTLIRLATQLVGPKKIFVPREELSEENKKEFYRIVKPDALAFLEKQGKPADYWAMT